ncbi:MAG: ATP-binding protein [Pseudomonadota bacterium]
MEKLKRAVGNYVTGDKFWDREEDIKLFTELLDEGAHILMAAPRRIGKTSLMRETAERLKDKYYCLHVDLQKAESPADAVTELSKATHPYKKLWLRTREVFKNILEGVKENIENLSIEDLTVTLRFGLTAGDWQIKGDQLFSTLAETDKPVVIFFDEFPILINRLLKGNEFLMTPERRQITDAFMSWVRDNSIRHKEKIRMVITGSIGIEPALRQADLSATLNTFTPFTLLPWTDEAAKGCLEALSNQYEIPFQPEAISLIIEKLRYLIPHHVQLFFDNVYEDWRRRKYPKVTPEHIEQVYSAQMLSIKGHAELSHMEERLKIVFGLEIYALALEILTETAVKGYLDSEAAIAICRGTEESGRDPKVTLRGILEILQHDGYLEQDEDRFIFISRLLRDWWKRRFSFGYTPVLERRA